VIATWTITLSGGKTLSTVSSATTGKTELGLIGKMGRLDRKADNGIVAVHGKILVGDVGKLTLRRLSADSSSWYVPILF
jgi:hypothetical protein